ncbi:MAG: DNA translocase FtsK 4TM domain-containing protein, partial [Nitrospirota bacterium]
MAERIKRIKEEVLGVVSVLGGVYLGLSLVTHARWDPSLFTSTASPVKNYGGIMGAYISDIMLVMIGISSFVIPLLVSVYGVKRLLAKEGHRIHVIGALLFVLSSSILLSLMTSTFDFKFESNPGGLTGLFISGKIKDLLSIPGAYIFCLSIFLSSIILLSPVSLVSFALNRKQEKAKDSEDMEEPLIDERQLVIQEPETAEPSLFEAEPEPVEQPKTVKPRKAGDYELPPLDLLKMYDSGIRPAKDELMASSELLEQKFADFDVEGKVTQVYPGPVVTMYEFEQAKGIKITKVVSLSDDIALALKAPAVRVSTISGKSAIGIEVPNRQRETVSLREIISSESFRKNHSMLTLALG